MEGVDPVAQYGGRSREAFLRLDGMDYVPDLSVISLYDPEFEEVAAFEELIGSHGGLGGPQTLPLIMHPGGLGARRGARRRTGRLPPDPPLGGAPPGPSLREGRERRAAADAGAGAGHRRGHGCLRDRRGGSRSASRSRPACGLRSSRPGSGGLRAPWSRLRRPGTGPRAPPASTMAGQRSRCRARPHLASPRTTTSMNELEARAHDR